MKLISGKPEMSGEESRARCQLELFLSLAG
jgi:hypothetical protein